MKKTVPIVIALAWFSIGLMLLMRGLKLAIYFPSEWAANFLGSWEKASLLSISFGLALGVAKGRMVFKKAVYKLMCKLQEGPLVKTLLKQMMIIPMMMGLGIGCAYLFPKSFMAVLDTAVGTALIYGGWTIFISLLFSRDRVSEIPYESK